MGYGQIRYFPGTNITDESVLEVSQQINRIALHFYHAAFRSASDICNIMREYSTLDASETSEVLAEGVNLQADIIRDVYDALNLLTAAMRTSTFILSPYQSEALDWALLYVVIAVERSAGPVEDFYEIYRNTSTAALQSAIPSLQMAVDSADQLHIDAAVGSTDASSPGK
ncbi:hypothetical protein H2203_002427 [Taxawa tesnikishii (nom. ined.)]|nr:hypothetical protein H2203_002427 [Dothideales sp. JES 119]